MKLLTVTLLAILLLNTAPAHAASGAEVQSIIASYAASLPPIRYVCGTGMVWGRTETTEQRESRLRSEKAWYAIVQKMRSYGPAGLPYIVQGLDHSDHRVVELCKRALIDTGSSAGPYITSKMRATTSSGNKILYLDVAQVLKTYTYDRPAKLKAVSELLTATGAPKALCWSTAQNLMFRVREGDVNAPDPEGTYLAQYALWFEEGLSDRSLQQSSAYLLKRCCERVSPEVSPKIAMTLAAILDAPDKNEEPLRNEQRFLKQIVSDTLPLLPVIPPAAIATLNRSVNSSDSHVAGNAVSALINLASANKTTSIGAVLNLLNEPDEDRRMKAIGGLRYLHANQSLVIPALLKFSAKPETLSAREAYFLAKDFEKYGKLSGPAVPILAKMLSRKEKNVQTAACDALYAMGPQARPAIPHLIALRDSTTDKYVAAMATRAINNISN